MSAKLSQTLFGLAQPGLFLLDPERAHELSLRALEAGVFPRAGKDDPRLAQELWGLRFPNPVGIAAGFDKDARAPAALAALGFGFCEIGTVTPRPQAGNPRPRVFRLPGHQAVINRLGFNSAGHAAALRRLMALRKGSVIGVNIGANRDSPDPLADYVEGLRRFYGVADYLAVNVSSPNTPGLRDLQAPERLKTLLARLMGERRARLDAGEQRRPVLLKLAPDIADEDLPAIVDCALGGGIDGFILTNTTLSRHGVPYAAHRGEAGGLSGAPLFNRSTRMLAKVHRLTGGGVPLIGVGGITSGERALAKIEAGASLVQLYTGLIYRGPGLIEEIKQTLIRHLKRSGSSSLAEIRGSQAERYSALPD